jgi:K+-sensing histidine kinase KdpD
MLHPYASGLCRDHWAGYPKGMTAAFQSKTFEFFFTGIKGQRRSDIGLSAAAGIVRAPGVYIYLRSKLDRGSAFKIYLPNG